MDDLMDSSVRTVTLVGAHERHNFGDWLLAYTAQSLLSGTETHWVNVMGRMGVGMSQDCGPFMAIWEAAASAETMPPVIHVGGETLTCDLLAAIRMSLEPDPGESLDPRLVIPLSRSLAYVTPAVEVVSGREVYWGPRVFFGVGGRAVDTLPAEIRSDLAAELSTARWVSVRDKRTQRALDALGVATRLHPDLVALLPALHADMETPSHSGGEILLQVSHQLIATWGPSLVLALCPLAASFQRLNIGVAGVAPHHDRLRDTLDLAEAINEVTAPGWARPTLEIHPLDIAARIRSSGLVVASSLHYRILAMGYAVPAVSIAVEKSIDYAEDWDLGRFGALDSSDISRTIADALEPSRQERLRHAKELQDTVTAEWRDAIETVVA